MQARQLCKQAVHASTFTQTVMQANSLASKTAMQADGSASRRSTSDGDASSRQSASIHKCKQTVSQASGQSYEKTVMQHTVNKQTVTKQTVNHRSWAVPIRQPCEQTFIKAASYVSRQSLKRAVTLAVRQ